MQRLKISAIMLVITLSVTSSGIGSTTLANTDLDLTSKAVLKAVQVQARYEGKEESRNSEMNYLRVENIALKVLICWLAVNNE